MRLRTEVEPATLKECRICFGDEDQPQLIAPCLCKGSQRWVHRACLDNWRATQPHGRAFNQCTTCHANYKIRLLQDGKDNWRMIKYRFLLARDATLAVAAVKLVVILIALFVRASSGGRYMHILLDAPKAAAVPVTEGITDISRTSSSLNSGESSISTPTIAINFEGPTTTTTTTIGGETISPSTPTTEFPVSDTPTDFGNGPNPETLPLSEEPRPSFWYYLAWAWFFFFMLLGLLTILASCCGALPDDVAVNCGGRGCNRLALGDCNCAGGGGAGILVLIAIALAIWGLIMGVLLSLSLAQKLGARHANVLWLKKETQRYVVVDLSTEEENGGLGGLDEDGRIEEEGRRGGAEEEEEVLFRAQQQVEEGRA